MNTVTTFENRTLGKVVRVRTDETGTWSEGSEVLTKAEAEMGRDGHMLDCQQTNKLFAYYHAARHDVRRV